MRNSNSNENENENGNENSNENENENANDNSNANDSTGEDEFEFKGTVQTILPDLWVIGGITVAVSPETSIRGKVAVGDKVEVHAFELPDGTLLAIEIKTEDEFFE